MILQYLTQLQQKNIILASASPRRQEILRNLGVAFKVQVSTFEEDLPHERFSDGAAYARETARHKAVDVAGVIAARSERADLIIAADTVVERDGVILEKPADAQHAFEMLSMLSGATHEVHTGVALVVPPAAAPETSAEPCFTSSFSTTTTVTFDRIPDADLHAYIATGEPFGKAGAYGIQGPAAAFVQRINGCYFNVVGFPVHRFAKELTTLIEQGVLVL